MKKMKMCLWQKARAEIHLSTTCNCVKKLEYRAACVVPLISNVEHLSDFFTWGFWQMERKGIGFGHFTLLLKTSEAKDSGLESQFKCRMWLLTAHPKSSAI